MTHEIADSVTRIKRTQILQVIPRLFCSLRHVYISLTANTIIYLKSEPWFFDCSWSPKFTAGSKVYRDGQLLRKCKVHEGLAKWANSCCSSRRANSIHTSVGTTPNSWYI